MVGSNLFHSMIPEESVFEKVMFDFNQRIQSTCLVALEDVFFGIKLKR